MPSAIAKRFIAVRPTGHRPTVSRQALDFANGAAQSTGEG
jgi:hypothetical protein